MRYISRVLRQLFIILSRQHQLLECSHTQAVYSSRYVDHYDKQINNINVTLKPLFLYILATFMGLSYIYSIPQRKSGRTLRRCQVQQSKWCILHWVEKYLTPCQDNPMSCLRPMSRTIFHHQLLVYYCGTLAIQHLMVKIKQGQ